MSVGSVRRRGQEGSPVLFPQQGPRCITAVCPTQVCLDSLGSCTEGKKRVAATDHAGGPIEYVCLYVNMLTIGAPFVVPILQESLPLLPLC